MRVYPVPGRFIQEVPAVEHDCDDPFCVESGAFTDKPPPRRAEAKHTETPPDGGALDSGDE